jgi:hypothetical protein
MGGVGLSPGDKVYVSGTLGTKYGAWNEPGTNANNEMFDPDGDGIYTIHLNLENGAHAFKFFYVPATEASGHTWNFGDSQPDRNYTFTGAANLIYVWGEAGFVTSVKDKALAGKVNIYPNPVRNDLTVNSTSDLRSATITSVVGKVVGKYTFNNAGTQNINTSNLSSGIYFVTFVGKDGNKVTQKLIKE